MLILNKGEESIYFSPFIMYFGSTEIQERPQEDTRMTIISNKCVLVWVCHYHDDLIINLPQSSVLPANLLCPQGKLLKLWM